MEWHQSTELQKMLLVGGDGNYTVKEGFKLLLFDLAIASENMWKKVWQSDCIPKINCFIWLLMHNKLLTVDNLSKRGIEGPSRCALCNSDLESALHLFLQCSVSVQA